MTFRGRPIFDWPIDWSRSVGGSWKYDLRSQEIGFGAPAYLATQERVQRGWSASITLRTAGECRLVDEFFDSLRGRLSGFWLPIPVEAARIVAVGSGGAYIDSAWSGTASTWEAGGDIYLLIADGSESIIATIASVAVVGGVERIAFASPVAWITMGASVRRLHYVRQVEDKEQGEWTSEGTQTRDIRVIELPQEYISAELGEEPVYLYRFWMDWPVGHEWLYTSFAAPVASQGSIFAPEAVTHKGRSESIEEPNGELAITLAWSGTTPPGWCVPLPPSKPLQIQVWMAPYGDPDTRTTLFSGWSKSISQEGDKHTVRAVDITGRWKRKIPRHMVQARCNYALFDPLTCRVNRLRLTVPAQIISVDSVSQPPVVVVRVLKLSPQIVSDGWFAHGVLEAGVGLGYEVRCVLSSALVEGYADRLTLQCNVPMFSARPGDMVDLSPGCDGSADTCRVKFQNFDNFGGFPFVPLRNPSLASANRQQPTGGKK